MSLGSTVLKETHKHNTPLRENSTSARATQAKQHSWEAPGPSIFLKPEPSTANLVPGKQSTRHISMENAVIGPEEQPITTTCFASPLRTLSESIKDPGQQCISIHDLIDAYNILSCRLRSHMHGIASCKQFLNVIEKSSSILVECLSRDLRRILPNPFESQHPSNYSIGHSCASDNFPSDEDLEVALDNDTLCHHALRLTADIFAFPTLYSTFSHNQLLSLHRDVLTICAATSQPIFNHQKTCALVLWMMKIQKLPNSILASDLVLLVAALRNALSSAVGGSTGKLDALQAIHFILQRCPDMLRPFLELLPPVLDHLNAEDLKIRIQAAFALCSFAVLKLDSPNFPRTEVLDVIQEYIDVQTDRRRHSPTDQLLPTMFKAALAHDRVWEGQGPGFVITVTSSLLVLLDHRLFTSPRSLKLIFSVLTTLGGRDFRGPAAHAEMWKILIWAFSRMPTSINFDEGSSHNDLATLVDTRERVSRVVRQELKNGLGVVLVSVLLNRNGERQDGDVAKAVSIVNDLLNSGDEDAIRDGTELLVRLTNGIGVRGGSGTAQRTCLPSFAKELVDASLLGKYWRKLDIPATPKPFEGICSLSEDEALAEWEDLSKAWIFLTRRCLHDLTADLANVIQIWQALLLVQAQLSQNLGHLIASPSFTSRAAAIITGFSVPLDTANTQARYLVIISKLWTTLKNTFTTACLSSPAEKILASLLKISFALADSQVKELWSQLCADLMSVGIPTLLHVLHRRSESQEGSEVTRQLWLVLAKNGPLGGEDGHWMDMLHFLVMPFGVWDMDSSEVEIWEDILRMALEDGAKSSKEHHEVISVFFNLFGDVKLSSLKQAPGILHCLLSHLACEPCSHATFKLLSLLDEVLISAHCHIAQKKAYALDMLRLVGDLILRATEKDIVEVLMALQASLCIWIADEDNVLAKDRQEELVSILYAASLEKLALVEPSTDLLHALASFIQSGFATAHQEGSQAFQKFWRSTYHSRSDISKKNLPVAIKACLKAWSDVYGDSLADDVSLGSESQSLESYTIPDSQPPESPSKSSDIVDMLLTGEGGFVSGVAFRQDHDGSSSEGTPTPARRNSEAEGSIQVTPDALRALQEYKDGDTVGTLPYFSGERSNAIAGPSRPLTVTKRPAEHEEPRTPKRRRTEPNFVPRTGKERAWDDDRFITYHAQNSVSEPVTRASSVVISNSHSASQPTRGRKPRAEYETPSWVGSDLKRLREPAIGDDETDTKPLLIPSSDDYDAWEHGVVEDLDDGQVDEEQLDSYVHSPMYARAERRTDPPSEDILSPSLGDYPLRSRRRDRSQTAPEQTANHESESIPIPQAGHPLRRNQTSPLEHIRTPSAQLDALQRAYAIITDTGSSQVDVQEIMHARRLANQINQFLDEQMCAKFGAGSKDEPHER